MQSVDRVLVLNRGPPWGFRLQELYPEGLIISEIRKNSPAELAGVQEQDKILAIQQISTSGMSRIRAFQLINDANYQLEIVVRRLEKRIKQNVLTFFLDTGSSRGQLIKQELTTKEMQLSRKRAPLPEIQSITSANIRPADPGVTSISIDKLMREFQPTSTGEPQLKKKIFSNSAFYTGTSVQYPSIDEQKALAHNVAHSIDSPMNKNSRGATIFETQRRRLEKLSVDASKNESLISNIPPISKDSHRKGNEEAFLNVHNTLSQPISPPPPPPLPPGPRRSLSVVEGMGKYGIPTKPINPQICFDLSTALHTSDSRGGNMFAKRKALSQDWEVNCLEAILPKAETIQREDKVKLVSKFVSKQDYDSSNRRCTIHQFSTVNGNSGKKNTIPDYAQTISDASIANKPIESIETACKDGSANGRFSASQSIPREEVETATGEGIAAPPKSIEKNSSPTWRPVKFNIPQ